MANFYGAGIGFGSGGAAGGWVFQGDEYGYLAGGTYHIPPSISADHVDKFAIASDSDSSASGMGTLDGLHQYPGGSTSDTHGYIVGGQNGYPAYVKSDMIQKWPYATDAGGIDTCNMPFVGAVAPGGANGVEIVMTNPYNQATTAITDFILTVQMATDADASNVASTTQARCENAAASDPAGGWSYAQSGQVCNSTRYRVIDRYQFGTGVDSTTVGDTSIAGRASWSGTCDKEYGYMAGGGYPPTDVIDRFQFGASSNSSDVGNLTRSTWGGGPVSSNTAGYFQGGWATSDIIQKYFHNSSNDAANVAVTSRRKDASASYGIPDA